VSTKHVNLNSMRNTWTRPAAVC